MSRHWFPPRWSPLIKLVVILGLALCLTLTPFFHAQAQLAVAEVNSVPILVELGKNLQQAVRLVTNSTRDLQALSDLASFANDATFLVAMAQDLANVYSQLDTIRQGWLMLTDPSHLPTTAQALYSWTQQAQMWALQGTRGGLEAFTQIMTAVVHSLQAMQRVVASLISRIGGSVAGLQSLAGLLQQGLGKAELLNAIVMNGQQALIGPQLIEQVKVLALPAIMQAEMRTWGQP